jgi:hypothetical protein
MAVYKIFVEKDATLYSDYDTMNTGMDAILELTKNTSLLYASQSSAARILIKFADTDISNVVNNYIQTNSYKAELKLFLADSTALPTDYTIEAYAISGTWDMGTGKYGNLPITKDGASWKYRNATKENQWEYSGMGAVSSYYGLNQGGGTWYTASVSTQSFGVYTNKDIDLDVTSLVKMYASGSLPNNGFILKTSGSLEFDPDYNYILNFFSRDTNTVYPPVLEFKWDDSSYNISGSSITTVTNSDIKVSIANNKGEYNQYEITRFRVNVREQYPTRVFATSSIYTTSKYLPTSSYYAIKDVKSDINVVDFDNSYTKISADQNGNYFDIYMYGLEPERYYKLLIKTVINGSTIIFDDRFFFKVTE